jgi:hypothetical protein
VTTDRHIETNQFGLKTMIVRASHGRDGAAKKLYQITEWPAARAEEWGIRALMAYNRGGGRMPVEQAFDRGMEGIVYLGIDTFLRGQMRAEEVQPILNELLECVKIVRDPAARGPDNKPIATDIVADSDIQEVATRMWLRSEVLFLHTGFSMADALSDLISAITGGRSPTTRTSPS